MSIYGDISMLNGAMRAFQYGLNTTSTNIANVNTSGYSRQVLGLGSASSIFDGTLALGQGVNATSLSRVRDTFLDNRIKFELSELGQASASKEALTELAAIFPEIAYASSTAGLKGAIDNVVNAWSSLAATPNIANQTAVRSALQALATMLTQDARKTFDLQSKVNDQVLDTLSQINSYADQIASLNAQIKALGGASLTGAPNILLDQREQAAEKLATLIDADFRITGDGTMSVTNGVATLVQGGTANHLIGINSPTDPGRTDIGFSAIQGATAKNITSSIQGGTLGGLLSVRDGAIEAARLDLDRMAFGIISRSNEINRTYTAGDGTTQHDLFLGNRAADMMLNPIVAANADYVGATRDSTSAGAVSGDLALMQSELKNFIQFSSMRTAPGFAPGAPTPIDPTQPLNTQSFSWLLQPSGDIVISTTGSALPPIAWNSGQSLDQIIANINAQGSGAFYATYNKTTQELIIVGETPLTVYDNTGNLLESFGISSVVTSSAPINNFPVPGGNLVDPFGPMNNTQNTLDLFSTPVSSGTVLIDNNPVNWNITDDIATTINLAISGATANPTKVGLSFNPTDQTVSVFRSGDPTSGNLGVLNFGLGNTMTAVQIVDKTGNLTRTLNLDTNTNSSKILDDLLVSLGSKVSSADVQVQQAQALVDQTQKLQDAQSSVDLNAELAQAKLYQRSYEASVRMQFILDEILNTLINHTGSSAADSSPV
jgi:flagellar hook-associated protein FlgK